MSSPHPEASGTVGDTLRALTARLAAGGIESAAIDARLLIQHALGLDRAALLARSRDPLPAGAGNMIDALVARRLAREPLSRIVGRREFWSLDLAVGPATLDPRPDSETLVRAALDRLPDSAAPYRLLDLGTGTGALLLALLSERPAAFGVGLDLSEEAARIARDNAMALGLARRAAFAVADWAAPVAARFDLVVSNPPYIPTGEIAGLVPEVARYDPPLALSGGPDGLDAYRDLSAALPVLLKPEGTAVVELGAGQAGPVARLMCEGGLVVAATAPDLSGTPRCLVLKKGIGPVGDCG